MTVFTWVAWVVYFSLYKNDCPFTVAPLAFAVKNSSILVAKKTLAFIRRLKSLPAAATASSPCFRLMVKKNKGKGEFVDEEKTLKKIDNPEFMAMRRMQRQFPKPST